MSFSVEPLPETRSAVSIARHGALTPFRPHRVIQSYVEGLLDRRSYQKLVSYDTTVELVEKVDGTRGAAEEGGKVQKNGEWRVVLRKWNEESQKDDWWEERFDAVVVASGHYNVPFIPETKGLEAFKERWPNGVEHSKGFRGWEKYAGKVRTSSTDSDSCVLARRHILPRHVYMHVFFGCCL